MADNPVVSQAFNAAGAKQARAKSPLSQAEAARRAEINDRLLRVAKWQFEQTTMSLVGTAYTTELYKQEKEVRDILMRQGNTALILDPATFDAAVALGMKPAEAAERMVLGERPGLLDVVEPYFKDGVLTGKPPVSPEDLEKCMAYMDLARQYDFQGIADDMYHPYKTQSGAMTRTQFPSAHNSGVIGSCVIVPSSDIGNVRVRGLSHADNQTWINLHESWHCRDSNINFMTPPLVPYDASADIRRLPDDAGVREAYARSNQMESFADVAAVGEMMRSKGKGMETLDAVMDFRQRSAAEVKHYTMPVLRAFREEIEKMGVEKFRKLNEQDAEKLYRRMVDENALTARGIKIIQDRESGNPLRSAGPMLVTRFIDDEVSRALAFRRSHTYDRFVGYSKELATWDREGGEIARELGKWNALKLLQDRAFADAGKITPTTLVQAYGDLKDELREKIKKDPGHRALYEAQLGKLRDTFVESTGKTDFVAVNLQRGVKIEVVEGMTDIAVPAAAATRTTAVSPGAARNGR
ncbi:MAG: hypothetical protein ACAH80_01035 [Alphaproteobacteria bacterium]